jgi:hypothetical protein
MKYAGLLNLPASTCDGFAVRHIHLAAGSTLTTATVRTVIFTGRRGRDLVVPAGGARFHELREGDSRWMTDLPIEQAQHVDCLARFHGTVLVGGLGLGVAVSLLARRRAVTRIVVVEIAQPVIDLVWPHLGRAVHQKAEIVCADLHAYLAAAPRVFDCAFYDIWVGDNVGTLLKTVLPLRRASPQIPRVTCWNEDVMRGQLRLQLVSGWMHGRRPMPDGTQLITLDELARPSGDPWHDWMAPFFRAMLDGGWVDDSDRVGREAFAYAARYGR